jgi:hypothetical protein
MYYSNFVEEVMQHRQIEIDIDVHRFLEGHRKSFDQTYNDILREVAKLGPASGTGASAEKGNGAGAWSGKGVTLLAGTKARMTYSGKVHTAVIDGGDWVVNGKRHGSPSAAAGGATGYSINGWGYWEVQVPGSSEWKPIWKLRRHD